MSYLTRPSNVRVYQFRQPPGCAAPLPVYVSGRGSG